MSEKNFPFELIPLKMLDSTTFFIDNVQKILKEDLQKRDSFGCKIKDCHTNLGSRKHLSSFIEAEILFQNSYYNKGFAYLTENLLRQNIPKEAKKVFLVGYETFGEMYLCETLKLVREKNPNIQIEYAVSESVGETKRIRSTVTRDFFDSSVFFVFVVPINTTLTTHDKLIKHFLGWFYERFQGADIVLEQKNRLNLALIVIGNDNNDYWDAKDNILYLKKERQEELRLIGNRGVHFFSKTAMDWEDSKLCKFCFPDLGKRRKKEERYSVNALNDLEKEEAIFEVNRASVVPMLQFESYPILEPLSEASKNKEAENIQRLLYLNESLIHSHIRRNENHYEYYFSSQYFLKYVKDLKDIGLSSWLQKIKETLFSADTKESMEYHFIVSPRHYSNAEFVHLVNNLVFENNARIIYFDVTKEYRGNFKAKYSDVRRLIQNLIQTNYKLSVHFHYVDDTIVSGGNFSRLYNLLSSLLDLSKPKEVSVKLFSSIILLFGRNSNDSKKWYIKEVNHFFEFTHLDISPMRHHEDACTLCKLIRTYKKVEGFCATNRMKIQIRKTLETHELKDIIEHIKLHPDNRFFAKPNEKIRVLLSHILAVRLKNKWWLSKEKKPFTVNSEKKEDIFQILDFYYNNLSALKKEIHIKNFPPYLTSVWEVEFIKVISRPFFSYHIRNKQAALKLCLNLLIKELNLKKEDMSFEIIRALVNALVDLHSIFLIRLPVLNKFLGSDGIFQNEEDILFYYKSVKKLVATSGDDSRSTLLETILVKRNEDFFFEEKKNRTNSPLKLTLQWKERLSLYIENNSSLSEGLSYISSLGSEIYREHSLPYNLKTYNDIFRINDFEGKREEIEKQFHNLTSMFEKKEYIGSPEEMFAIIVENLNHFYKDDESKGDIKIFYYVRDFDLTLDKFYPATNQLKNASHFYLNENLSLLDTACKKEDFQILDTIEILDNDCALLRFSKDYGEVYFLASQIDKKGKNWFVLKLLSLLRSKLENLFESINISNEIHKKILERRTKAMSISKAHAHYSRENTESMDILKFDSYLGNCDEKKACCSSTKLLYDKYLFLLSNNFISDLYRNVISDSKMIYEGTRLYYLRGDEIENRLLHELKSIGFSQTGSSNDEYLYNFFVSSKDNADSYIKIKMYICISGFFNKKIWSYKKGGATIQTYIFLFFAFASNAAYHASGKSKEIDFYISAEENDIIFQNKLSEKANLPSLQKKIKEKKEIPPWEHEEDKQSITFWSFSRFFQILNRDIENYKLKENTAEEFPNKYLGKHCPNVSTPLRDFSVSIKEDTFIVKLTLLEDIR